MKRDAQGRIAVPLKGERDARYVEAARVEEPRKPAIVEVVDVLVEPGPGLEDRTFFSSTVNTTIVYTGEKGSIAGQTAPIGLWPDPLELLRSPEGPFFGPASGEGLILIVASASAGATVDRHDVPLAPARTRTGSKPVGVLETDPPSLPSIVTLEPGNHALRVTRPGWKTLETSVAVHRGEYALVFVRLASEGARAP